MTDACTFNIMFFDEFSMHRLTAVDGRVDRCTRPKHIFERQHDSTSPSTAQQTWLPHPGPTTHPDEQPANNACIRTAAAGRSTTQRWSRAAEHRGSRQVAVARYQHPATEPPYPHFPSPLPLLYRWGGRGTPPRRRRRGGFDSFTRAVSLHYSPCGSQRRRFTVLAGQVILL